MTQEAAHIDVSPMFKTGVEKEPILLLDVTGSNGEPAAPGSSVRRLDVILEALPQIVAVLGAEDSQAADEQAAAGDDEAGGLMTITFASNTAKVLGDLNPENITQKLREIQWGGTTYIMPGWELVVENYMEEFGDTPITERPHLLCLCITDGEALDTDQFAQVLSQTKGGIYIAVAVLGYGPAHDAALAAYQQIATTNKHVRVVTFGATTNADEIAQGLLSIAQ
ncbi:MAG: vWA domain-containing protein [Chloroflexota bacterium]|nr:MAG: hypothetical protein DLM70_15410 [Chloroflexota bacterium]